MSKANLFHPVSSFLPLSPDPMYLPTHASSPPHLILNLRLCSQPSNESCTLSSITARSVAQVSWSNRERSGADLITSRAEDLDL